MNRDKIYFQYQRSYEVIYKIDLSKIKQIFLLHLPLSFITVSLNSKQNDNEKKKYNKKIKQQQQSNYSCPYNSNGFASGRVLNVELLSVGVSKLQGLQVTRLISQKKKKDQLSLCFPRLSRRHCVPKRIRSILHQNINKHLHGNAVNTHKNSPKGDISKNCNSYKG